MASASEESHDLHELRIVLLGVSSVGKSATGNVIMGREAFKETRTRVSEVQRGRVEYRNISVIDTPGFFNTELTDEDLHNEMMKGLSLSHPGPHVFLLIINMQTFKKDDRNFLKQIQDTFGEESLFFTMILFIGRENMSRREFTQFIENEKTEQMLSSFNRRYHVMNSKSEHDTIQIEKLLKNIDVMVKNYGGEHYVTEIYLNRLREERERKKEEHLEEELKNIREEVKEKHALVELKKEMLTKRQEEMQERQYELKKAHKVLRTLEEVLELTKRKEVMKERHNDMKKTQEDFARRQEEVSKRHEELKKRHKDLRQRYEERMRLLQESVRRQKRRILRPKTSFLERKGSMDHPHTDLRIVLLGKTGSGKSSSGSTILNRDSFQSKCSLVPVTGSCQKENVDQRGRSISVIDTPGLFDTSMTQEKLKSEIEKCVEMSAPGPHVFLLVIRLDMRITDEEMNSVKWIHKNFGEDAVKYTIVLFTHADELEDETLEEYVKPSNDIKALLNQYDSRYHSFNNKTKGNQDQVRKLLEKIDEMVKGNGGMYYTNDMYKAQRRIDQDHFRQKAIEYGTTALTVGVGVAVGGAALAIVGAPAAVALLKTAAEAVVAIAGAAGTAELAAAAAAKLKMAAGAAAAELKMAAGAVVTVVAKATSR